MTIELREDWYGVTNWFLTCEFDLLFSEIPLIRLLNSLCSFVQLLLVNL